MNIIDFESKVVYMTLVNSGCTHVNRMEFKMSEKNINSLLQKFQDICLDANLGVRILHEDGNVADKITVYVFPEEVIENANKASELTEIEDSYSLLLEETAQKRKPKRKSEDLPDPSQSPKAWVNRKDYSPPNPTYSTKISPNMSKTVGEFREKHSLTKKDMTEQALALFMEVYEK